MADERTGEGWQAMGFPIDDYIPWALWSQAKEIAAQDKKYLVIAGYLVATPNSTVLYPNEEASRSGRLDGALILTREDSPALRWLVGKGRIEGVCAVGGVISTSPKGPQLGYLAKIRFAMRQADSTQPIPP